jgi:predicted kinase
MAHLLILRGVIGAGKTSVAAELSRRRPELAVVEVDDLKVERHGTTGVCVPHLEFPEAGRLARETLASGRLTVVIEPLCDPSHLKLVLDEVGRTQDSSDISFVWLECAQETSMARTKDLYPPHIIEDQFARYPARCQPAGERVIRTDDLSVAQVADVVQGLIPG